MNDKQKLSEALALGDQYRDAAANGRLVYLMPNGNAGSFSDLPPGSKVICVGFFDTKADFVPTLFDFGKKAP